MVAAMALAMQWVAWGEWERYEGGGGEWAGGWMRVWAGKGRGGEGVWGAWVGGWVWVDEARVFSLGMATLQDQNWTQATPH